MAHELRFGYVDIHGAGTCALTAVTAFVGITLDTEDTQHAPEPSACTTGAEVITEGALEEHGDKQKQDDNSGGPRQEIPVKESVEVMRPLE